MSRLKNRLSEEQKKGIEPSKEFVCGEENRNVSATGQSLLSICTPLRCRLRRHAEASVVSDTSWQTFFLI